MKSLSADDLKDAITSFPDFCIGDITAFVLWPYESLYSYLAVKAKVDANLAKQAYGKQVL